jgi:putative transposase
MIDEHTCESLMKIVERSIAAERLVAELETAFILAGGPPKVLRTDNGPKLVDIPPGRPWVNGHIQ